MECSNHRKERTDQPIFATFQYSNIPVFHYYILSGGSMRDLVMRYLSRDLTRRSFIKAMAAAGFTLTAAESVLNSLTPLAEAQTVAPEAVKIVEGTGGEVLVQQLIWFRERCGLPLVSLR